MLAPPFPIRLLHSLLLASTAWSSLVASAAIAADRPVTAEQEKYFEEKVRPVLVANCLECHGEKKQESGLRLDSRKAMIDGGDSGERAVVPGEPDRSLLVKAINHLGDIHMPPETKLPVEQIDVLTEWIRQGLPWPESSQSALPSESAAERAAPHRQNHWAYQPVTRPAAPSVKNTAWLRTPLDAFILGKLEAADLAPSPEVDRRTYIRRATFDLLGIPPTPDEVAAFEADAAPDAHSRLVDRLLASPRYGERWGRHWLDVARYGDTKGYAFAQERKYPYAYTYRDYVIRAFNADLPYDRFVTEQIAADLLDLGSEKLPLAALGFLTTGRKFNNHQDDLDDQIDVVTRGLLGLTVACARCHDHKYDAIPTEDYYSLYGVFDSCTTPDELPLIAPPTESAEYQAFDKELQKKRDEMDQFISGKHAEFLDQARRQAADYLVRVAAGEQNTLLAKLPFLSLDPKDLRPRMIQRWQKYLDDHAKPDDPTLGLWRELMKVRNEKFSEESPKIVEKWKSLPDGLAAGQCNPLVKAAFAADVPATRPDVARIYGKLLTEAYEKWLAGGKDGQPPADRDAALFALPMEVRQLAEVIVGKDSPTDVSKDDAREFLNRADRNKYSELKKAVESFQANSPAAPPRAMVLADRPAPQEPRVFVRGKPDRPGKHVPRQFLLVMAENRQPFIRGSGRLELAQEIVRPENPLTRRVIVNRVWMHHFGEPLVLTPSDFGIRTEVPIQADLLDHLASDLWESGWSLKALHRQMVLSATYRQASNDRPECRVADSENRLFWRMNRRRLELEAMRDSLLACAGALDPAMYGKPVELTTSPFSRRRAVYGFIDRQDLPNLFRVFDIASPDSSTPRRPRTTVPQQSLFLMNSPLVVEQARSLASRPEVAAAADTAAKISSLYRTVLQREPAADELGIGQQFLASCEGDQPSGMKLTPWEQYAQLLLLTNEAMYID